MAESSRIKALFMPFSSRNVTLVRAAVAPRSDPFGYSMSMQRRQMVSSPVWMTKTRGREVPNQLEPMPGRRGRAAREEELRVAPSGRQPKAKPCKLRGDHTASGQIDRMPSAVFLLRRGPAVGKDPQTPQATTMKNERAQ
jgi:hypothetical protein